MKKSLLSLFILLLLGSCNTDAIEPKFQKVENIVVRDLSATKVNIEADAVVYNPNSVSIFMNSIELDVYANETLVGHVSQTRQTEIAKKDNFSIPLAVSFNPTRMFKDNPMGLLESAVNAYTNQKVTLELEGSAQFEVKGISFNVPIAYQGEILLKEE